jgi:hypothetical protein
MMENLAAGARRRIARRQRRSAITLKLSDALHTKIEAEAERTGQTCNEVIVRRLGEVFLKIVRSRNS